MAQASSYAHRIYERLTTAIHRSLLFIFLFVAPIGLANAGVESDFYIFTVDVSAEDDSLAGQFILPSPDSNYQLAWEEVGNEAGNNSGGFVQITTAHELLDFGSPGIYRIKVDPIDVATGVNDFDSLTMSADRDSDKLISMEQWGTAQWTDLQYAFAYASNFTGITAIDTPNLSSVTSLYRMFLNAASMTNTVGIENWDTSAVVNMQGVFNGATLTNPNVGTWVTTNVTNMSYMFKNAPNANPDTSSWDTSKVLYMNEMFRGASIATPDTSAWDTSLVVNMYAMFTGAYLANPDTSGWNVSSVTNMASLFQDAHVATPDTSGWDTSSVTTMANMFYRANVATPDTSGWNTSSVTTMSGMFFGASQANPQTAGWNTALVTNMASMFVNAPLVNPVTSGWDTTNVTNMYRLFYNAAAANPDTSGWDTSSVTSMREMFTGAVIANPDTSGWDTSSVTDMARMFYLARSANPDTSGWNTSLVIGMDSMFNNAVVATPDTSGWDTAQVKDMAYMFYNAQLANPNTSGWDTSLVTNMGYMFLGASVANPDTSGWDTSRVTSMYAMFQGAVLAEPDTSGWDTSLVTNMQSMFNGASVANPDTSGWDTSRVTSMYAMFQGAVLAEPDTSGWNTSNVTNMEFMFRYAAAANPDTSGWDTSNLSSMRDMFNGASSANPDTSGWDTSNVTNMYAMFNVASSANPDTSGWDTSLVTNMAYLFSGAVVANPDTSGWDTSNVTNMAFMFRSAANADPDTSGFDTSKVTNFDRMFEGAIAANPDTSGWNTSLVTNMYAMFNGATVANPDTSNWDTASVVDMHAMFNNTQVANPDVSNWNTVSVTRMSNMFSNTAAANPDTSAWNVSNVTNMSNMFASASVADPDVSNWNTSAVTNMSAMFRYTTSSSPDMSNWDTSNVTNMYAMLQNNVMTNADLTGLDFDSVTNAQFFLSGSFLTAEQYDAFLQVLDSQTLQPGLTIHFQDSQYCSAEAARQSIVDNDGWVISDSGKNCTVELLQEVLEDSVSGGGAGNANSALITANQLLDIVGLTGVNPTNESQYQALIASESNFSNPVLLAELQAIIDAANASVDALAEVLEDSASSGGASNANAAAVTAAQLSAITGVTGVDPANEAEYQALLAGATNLSNPPTVTEVQAIIDVANDSVTALAEVLEDSNSAGGANDANATGVSASQLAAIIGITDVNPANEAEYQSLIANATNLSNPPTFAEVQAIIDAANASVNAFAEVLEDSAGGGSNANNAAITVAQLSAITGISNINPANEAEYQALIADATGLSSPPTLAEVQAIISSANASVNSLALVLEDSASTGGDNNSDGVAVTAAELSAITGIINVNPANEAQYQALIADATNLSNPPKLAEVQAIIDTANASVSSLAKVLEDSGSAGGSNNADGTPVSAAQLAAITGITGVDPANETDYQALIANAMTLSSPPTVAEVQAIIDAANASVNSLASILEDSNSTGGSANADGVAVTAAQLAAVSGIAGVDPANEAQYQALIANTTTLSNPPTVEEIQVLINEVNTSVNSLANVLNSSSSEGAVNENATAVSAEQLATITGLTGVVPANEAEYQALIANATDLSNPPTLAEVQAIVDEANESVNVLASVLEDSASAGGDNNADGVAITAAQLAAISGITGVNPANEAEYQALIAEAANLSNPPTLAEVQAIVDAANASVNALTIVSSWSSAGGDGATANPVSAEQLSQISDITNVNSENEAQYQALIASATNLSSPPTVAEVQAIIDAANASVSALDGVLNSSSSSGADGGSRPAITAAELAAITGVTGVELQNELAYQALIASATELSNPPTVAEIQAIIDEANTSEAVLSQVSSSASGGEPVTAAQLSLISGVSRVNPDNEAAYQALMEQGAGLSSPPTAEEIQALIDSVNDADGDGLSDGIEQGVDTDGDGLSDENDNDSDNDGVSDRDEGAGDSDGDGVANFRDRDSDNDGIFDWYESNTDAQLIARLDSNADGAIDLIHSVGANGIVDGIESPTDSGELIYVLSDTDEDGVPDYRDSDSDNDGLFDTVEAGNADGDLDGRIDDGFAPGVFQDAGENLGSNLFLDSNGVLEGAGGAPRDTDKDQVADFRDTDSDNDGMSDVLESFGAQSDQDQDGQIDNFVDADGDGASDEHEASNLNVNDTDGDGLLDAIDTDSDGDGIADVVENGSQDVDGDGQVDNFLDTNGDGLDDGIAFLPVEVLDADGDGIPNYRDLDSDGDGFTDLEESGGVDTDGDGNADSLTLGAAMPDTNLDGIPDHLQANLGGVIRTGQGWGGSGGCSVMSLRGASSTSGFFKMDPLFVILTVMSLLWLVSRQRGKACKELATRRSAKGRKKLVAVSALALLSSGCSVMDKSTNVLSDSRAQYLGANGSTKPDLYVSTGVGVSRMKPDTSDIPGVGVSDQTDTGIQLSIGADITRRLSLEIHTSDLGASNISTGDEVLYRVHGGSALWYAGKRNRVGAGTGLNGYGRIGFGVLENSTTGVAEYEQESRTQMLVGAGLEYGMASGLGLRAEVVAFEQSVQYGQVGIIYRFGTRSEPKQAVNRASVTEASTIAMEPVQSPVVLAAKPGSHSAEPVLAAATAACVSVSRTKLLFKNNSARLDSADQKILDDIVEALLPCKKSRIEIVGHADSAGDENWNVRLSKSRAESVMNYLASQHSNNSDYVIRALGEGAPIASNMTSEGRAMNRRVEILITNK